MRAVSPSVTINANLPSIAGLSGVPRLFKLGLKLLLRFEHGELTVVLPDHRAIKFEGKTPGPAAVMRIDNYSMVRRVMAGGDVGFAESYMDGQWSTPDLAHVLEVFSANLDRLDKIHAGGPLTRMVHWLVHRLRPNTKTGARKNIEAHYDLGNDFYSAWLDETMTYSAARYRYAGQSLKDAQNEKYRALAQKIDLKPGQSVLEIGCGWGGFAEFAAREIGAHVTCLTLSPSQLYYAKTRIERLGLSDKVEFKLQDYRDEIGQYDHIVSIEMFEAVGQEYWPTYFETLHRCLKPGGKAGLQVITIRDDLFESYSKRADFIQRYIFPGGVLPSPEKLGTAVQSADLSLIDQDMFALDYADTLKEWMGQFKAVWAEKIEPMGFDLRFKKMWEFYLAYCEAGFRTGRIDVGHFTIEKQA